MQSASTMMRSANVCLALLRQNPQNYEVRRMWQKVIPASCACLRLLHVSNHQLKDESDSTRPKTARKLLRPEQQLKDDSNSAQPVTTRKLSKPEQQLKDDSNSAQPMTTRKLRKPEQHESSRQLKHDSDSAHPVTTRKPLRPERGDSRLKSVNTNTKRIVINVAKSMPGDWSKTADELLNRLMMSENGTPQTQAAAKSKSEDKPDRSLLHSMNIARPLTGPLRHRQPDTPREVREAGTAENDLYRLPQFRVSPRRVARRQDNFTELFGAPRLGIFDAEKLKKEAGEQQPVAIKADDLWVRMDEEKMRRILGGVPRNGFEEMIQWTKEGKLWKFPIDNEADMDEEKKYKFHQHIFLEEHLTQFPDKGPIRKFMELVVLGLSRNPWISVPEKVEHIQWFAQYFREKQSILEAAIGEQGKMKEGSGQLEGGK